MGLIINHYRFLYDFYMMKLKVSFELKYFRSIKNN